MTENVWIDHDGGEQPANAHLMYIDLKLRDGSLRYAAPGAPIFWPWLHLWAPRPGREPSGIDIVAWRPSIGHAP